MSTDLRDEYADLFQHIRKFVQRRETARERLEQWLGLSIQGIPGERHPQSIVNECNTALSHCRERATLLNTSLGVALAHHSLDIDLAPLHVLERDGLSGSQLDYAEEFLRALVFQVAESAAALPPDEDQPPVLGP